MGNLRALKEQASMLFKRTLVWSIQWGGVDSDRPVYFGMHFCNDPYLGGVGSARQLRNSIPCHNVVVLEDLSVLALVNIRPGDELFLNYNYTDEADCCCTGCLNGQAFF